MKPCWSFNRLSLRSRAQVLTIALAAIGTLASSALSAEPDPMDWPHWRGPQQNSVSTETGLVDHWDPRGGPGSNLLWKSTELAGRSTPIVLRGLLYTIVRDRVGQPDEAAKVVCVDAATGDKQWEHRFNVYLSDVPDTRVGWSSCTGDPETGRVYAQSVSGYFCCLEGATGKAVWERSLHEEFGLLSTYGGRTNVPLVFEDLVITSAVVIGWGDSAEWGSLAKPAHRFLAFDKATGELRWLKGTGISPYDTTYSTPTISVINGQAAMVFGSGDGSLWALQPRTGERLWHFPFSRRGLNVSPLVVGNTVYSSHSEENIVGNTMGGLVAIDATQRGDLSKKQLWQKYEVMAGKSSPVMVGGRLWVVDDRAKLNIFDPASGERIARKALGTVMRSTPLVADGKVYLCTNNGRWYILQPTDSGVKVLHKLRLAGESSDGSPMVSHGRIYFPTSGALYCIGRKDQRPVANPLPSQPAEASAEEDQVPAVVQVSPYDVLLAPDETQQYTVRTYNSRGQLLKTLSPGDISTSDFMMQFRGPGDISVDGLYTASSESEHATALVEFHLGDDLVGTARMRIVPPLPWQFHFDFSEKVPLTWIGGRVRYVVREDQESPFAVKRSVLPTPRDPKNKLGTRSRMWMGSTELADYTIQADVALTTEGGRLPDVGLINSRYTMTLRGSTRELRIYSWSPHDTRTFARVAFEPKPGEWYTMKLRVEPTETKATVRGKIWPRNTEEPSEWTVEMVDPSPNLHGSPGLYGNAQEAEFMLDNISVEAN